MVSSRRNLQPQDPELNPTGHRGRARPALAGLVAVAMVAGLAGIPWTGAKPTAATLPVPVTAASREAWVHIASDLMDVVPASILLGGGGSTAELDARLGELGLDRDLFRRTAIAIRGECACAQDEAEQAALAMSMGRVRTADKFEVCRAPASLTEEPASQATRDLVVALIARIPTHPEGHEHP